MFDESNEQAYVDGGTDARLLEGKRDVLQRCNGGDGRPCCGTEPEAEAEK